MELSSQTLSADGSTAEVSRTRSEGLRHLRSLFRHNLKMGFRAAISGLNFHSCRESLLVCETVFGSGQADEKAKILDIATWRSVLPAYLAECGHESVTADLGEGRAIQEGFRRRLRHPENMDNVEVPMMAPEEIAYPFDDASFDIITVINALTVFRGEGDIVVLREIYRMLKPGGKAVITVPRGDYVERDFGKWFARCYNDQAIADRLINSTPLELESSQLFGSAKEDRFVSLYWKLPGFLRIGLGNLWYPMFLRYLPYEDPHEEGHKHAGVGLVLSKPV